MSRAGGSIVRCVVNQSSGRRCGQWGVSVPYRQWQRLYGYEEDDAAEVGNIKEYQLMKKLISCIAGGS